MPKIELALDIRGLSADDQELQLTLKRVQIFGRMVQCSGTLSVYNEVRNVADGIRSQRF